ncbi:Golgin subfamily A member 7/ERF4 family-domain-containing protein [Diplogelasinospora grovesii]|uniref:Ras modification protein ERF4 n=1 Tax=Diplogelasinospora grovesii TaxID=303347 RepID=A0AAN6N664_9PEZI|nr:Golgin subfamily A member 7/ERF4 family-domain-containing protein [Diplogelasinospora grovesii]
MQWPLISTSLPLWVRHTTRDLHPHLHQKRRALHTGKKPKRLALHRRLLQPSQDSHLHDDKCDRHNPVLSPPRTHRKRLSLCDEADKVRSVPDLQRLLAAKAQLRRRRQFSVEGAVSAAATISLSPPPPFSPNPRIPSPSQQPTYPGASTPTPPLPSLPSLPPSVAQARQPRRNSLLRRGYGGPQDYLLQSPFRTRAAAASSAGSPFHHPLRRLSAARLWNPTNSTPRTPSTSPASSAPAARRRRPSTPPPPAVPLPHPTGDAADPTGTGAGDYPLLTLSEQHQNRLSISNRASLQIERSAGSEQRISLPRSVRHSYDGKRASVTPSPVEGQVTVAGPSVVRQPVQEEAPKPPRATGFRKRGQSVSNPKPQAAVGLSFDSSPQRKPKIDKGKGKAIMSKDSERDSGRDSGRAGFSQDLERGPDVMDHRRSTASRVSGIGSAISSSDSSIMGDPDQQAADVGEEWGPLHPCYPHLNPHVPVDSPEYANTRIIRIRRDWLLEGDLAPTFSNLYPEILDPAGLTEQEFRRVIDKLNGELVPAFNPYSWRNLLDGVLGLATGWLWDDFGLTGIKSRLSALEKWIEQWNAEMEKTFSGADEAAIPPKIVSLRRTGYMSLDIQIPDPEIAPAPPSTPGARSHTGVIPDNPPQL